MFQYEYEKSRPDRDWSRSYPNGSEGGRSAPASDVGTVVSGYSRRALPLPPRPATVICSREHSTKPTPRDIVNEVDVVTIPKNELPQVPLKVWIIASASCFAVCAALVLATVVITKWGTDFSTHAHYIEEPPAPIYSHPQPIYTNIPKSTTQTSTEEDLPIASEEVDNDIEFPILEKLSIFKNMVANRDKSKKVEPDTLISKPQIHPLHDITMHHPEKKIEKKDQAKHPDMVNGVINKDIPDFKPTLPDVFINKNFDIKLPDGFTGFRKYDNEYYSDYYNDENLYDDYMQSNTMTSYLIEKVQELHDWINADSDFDAANNSTKVVKPKNEFSQVLKALNESLIEGNVTIIMNKLKDIYFGDNYTNSDHSRKVILSNSTDLLSFGILSLDVMLLHNIQLMAWENQESARNKMLKDPDVFAFNALFLEPSKVEAKYNEVIYHQEKPLKRQSLRQEDEYDIGRNLLENILEIGMSTARAAIHLGRAYKNTKMVVSQLSNANPEKLNANIQSLSRNIESNTHALNHLQTSFHKNDSSASVASAAGTAYTELDCVWLLYCKNLVVTAKLNAPYGVMARINGMALRMLTGELSADKALDTMIYEALTGWTELRCPDMFPKCSKVNAAKVVMESLLQPLRKSQSSNKTR